MSMDWYNTGGKDEEQYGVFYETDEEVHPDDKWIFDFTFLVCKTEVEAKAFVEEHERNGKRVPLGNGDRRYPNAKATFKKRTVSYGEWH